MTISLIKEFLDQEKYEKQGSCPDPRPWYTCGYHMFENKLWFVTKYCFIAASPFWERKIVKYFHEAKNLDNESFPFKFYLSGDYIVQDELLWKVDIEKPRFTYQNLVFDTKWMKYLYNINDVLNYGVKLNEKYKYSSPIQLQNTNSETVAVILPICGEGEKK